MITLTTPISSPIGNIAPTALLCSFGADASLTSAVIIYAPCDPAGVLIPQKGQVDARVTLGKADIDVLLNTPGSLLARVHAALQSAQPALSGAVDIPAAKT